MDQKKQILEYIGKILDGDIRGTISIHHFDVESPEMARQLLIESGADHLEEEKVRGEIAKDYDYFKGKFSDFESIEIMASHFY